MMTNIRFARAWLEPSNDRVSDGLGVDSSDARDARLRALVDEHRDFVARALSSAGTPAPDVDDQVQLTFIAAARRLDDIRTGCEKAFLFRIAMNLTYRLQRTHGRRHEVLQGDSIERVDQLATPEHAVALKWMADRLRTILDQIEERAREVFVLHELDELPMGEIANLLGIPPGTVASRLRRARAELRKRTSMLQDHATTDEAQSR
jgi:RNA polymerase sigma-70 factor (ECF subfamily)